MFALDLFNTRYERELQEGAVDNLEARRIEDLNDRMDYMMKAYKQADSDEVRAAIKKRYEEFKAERDGYYKVNTPKTQDECMGYGTLGETGLPDVADKQAKMARLNQPNKAGIDLVTPQQRVNPNPNKGIIGHAADWLRGKGGPGREGPTYESELDEAYGAVGSKALMNGNFAEFLKRRASREPYDMDFGSEKIRMTPAIMDAIAKKYMDDKHASDASPKNRDLKQNAVNNYRSFGYPNLMKQLIASVATPGEPGEQLPMFEKAQSFQKKKSEEPPLTGRDVKNTRLSRELIKARAAYPAARSDIEALVMRDLDHADQVDAELKTKQNTDAKQDQALQQAQAVNQDQAKNIQALQSRLSAVQQQLQIPTAKAVAPTQSTAEPVKQPGAAVRMPEPIYTEPGVAQDQDLRDKVKQLDDLAKAATMAALQRPDDKDMQAELKQQIDNLQKQIEKLSKKTVAKKKKKMTYKKVQKPGKEAPALPDPNVIDVDAFEIPTMDIPSQDDLIGAVPNDDTAQNDRPAELQKAAEGVEKPTGIGQMAKNVGQGQELQRDPAYRNQVRRTQQQVSQRQRNVARGQAGYGEEPDDFGDIPDMTEGAMSELDIERQDLEHMTDQQFQRAYGISKEFWKYKNQALLKKPRRRPMSAQLARSPVGKKMTAMYGSTCPGCGRSTNPDRCVCEGYQDFKKPEPYAVCLAGRPVKQFDYYEQARRFHDNWKQKLYREGNKEKADKITLMPLNLDEEEQKPADPNEFRPVGPITIVPPKKLKSGETYQDRNKYWQSQGQAPIYKTNEMDKSQTPPGRAGDYPLGVKGTTGKPVTAKKVVKDLTKDLNQAFSKEKKVKEAANPAQQAAIAIAMKKAGKKPKQADEAYTPSPAKPFRNPRGFNKQGTGVGNKLADLNRKEWEEKKKKEQGVAEGLEDSTIQSAIVDTVERLFRKNEISDYGALEAIRQGIKHHFSKPGATTESAIEGILNILDKRMRKSGDYVDLGRFKEALRQGIAHQLNKQGVAKDQDFNNGYNEKPQLEQQGVAEGHADQQRRVFKKNGEPVGEVGIDRESSPGNGQWYMKHYASGKDLAGYDSYEEALAELKHCMKQGVAEDTGSWIVYDPETKQIKKRFKTHTAGKSYAKTHGLGFASSEYYFDNIKDAVDEGWKQNVAAGILGATMALGSAPTRANTDINVNPVQVQQMQKKADLTQKYVNVLVQRAKDDGRPLDTRAMNTIKAQASDMAARQLQAQGATQQQTSQQQNFPSQGSERVVSPNYRQFEESQTDYQKRRQRERDVDAGRPVKPLPKNPQTDYARKRAQDKKDMEMGEGLTTEPTNRKEYLDQRDKLFRMLAVETNPANKQIIKTAIKNLDARYGSAKDPIREESSTSSEAVEIALIRRVLVSHTDLIMEFGLDKVTQAIEEVAYNVGDVDEIGTSDVSGWMNQVKQILGVPEELDEKWSEKYKRSINCASPKGFSQRAHCASKKK